MIFKDEKLSQTNPLIVRAIDEFHVGLDPIDILILAANDEMLLRVHDSEKRLKQTLTKPSWEKMVAKGDGVILLVQSNSFRRKSNDKINVAWNAQQSNIDGIVFEKLEKNERFDVFFIGIKSKKQTIESESPIDSQSN
jgi:hypothetical protein